MKNQLVSCLLVFCFACSSTKKNMEDVSTNTAKRIYVQGEFDKQGHRGCRGLMPENTVPAMLYALGMGVTTLEMDVVITRDKKVILSHDQWFGQEITTKPDGSYMRDLEERKFNIYWMTYEQTKTFDVGMKPHPRFPRQQKMKVTKPLLSDVIDSVNKSMITMRRPFPYYNIETKSNPAFDGVFQPKPEEFVELLMAVIREKHIEEQVIIQSFDFRTLQYLHEHYPAIKTAMLIEDFDKRTLEEQLKALGFTPTIYSPAYQLVTETLLKKCHDQNIKVIPWTVNEKEKITELKKLGVDGIITDYPDLFNE
ncbi:MAG TPA: glycerophosphodiester phosphodiesterase [Chitinophagaceae bacterium]|jgi:glycerophosphoryl diester phosphodiesterase|nr:glycerophosphodiester phosphodiesterase [Chitinophagaceae bacterium]